MNDNFFELNENEKKELGEFKAMKIQSKLHYLQGYITELENRISLLIDQNNELKKITKSIKAIPKEKNEEYIMIADKRFFDEGVFITNYIEDKKIKYLIKQLKEENEKQKFQYKHIYKSIIIDLERLLNMKDKE